MTVVLPDLDGRKLPVEANTAKGRSPYHVGSKVQDPQPRTTVALADLYKCRVSVQAENQSLVLRSQGESMPAADRHRLAVDATRHFPSGVTRHHHLTAAISVHALQHDSNPSLMAGLHSAAGPDHHAEYPGSSIGVHDGLAAAGSTPDLKQHQGCTDHKVTDDLADLESADVRNLLQGSV